MAQDKPALPKRLAAKIVAAQRKVTDARAKIHHNETRIQQNARAIAAYERDPEAYAAKHYRGSAVNSYPVQANQRRRREEVDYRESRREHYLGMLVAADANLVHVELQVLAELRQMRPDTPGRIDWPAPLPSFGKARARWRREDAEQDRAWAVQHARDQHEAAAQQAEELRALDAQYEAEWAQWRAQVQAHWAALSEPERVKAQAQHEALVQALRDGRMTVFDVIEAVRRSA